jgi:hypothetical protein
MPAQPRPFPSPPPRLSIINSKLSITPMIHPASMYHFVSFCIIAPSIKAPRRNPSARSQQLPNRQLVHIVKRLVLPAHGPDEAVVLRAGAGVDRPTGGNDGLAVF